MMSMCKRTAGKWALSLLVTFIVLALSACGGGGNDQPQVEQLTKEQAAKKQALDDGLRTRLRTTQSDR
jgi:hypothetical protein